MQNIITTVLTDKAARSERAIEALLTQMLSDLSSPWTFQSSLSEASEA